MGKRSFTTLGLAKGQDHGPYPQVHRRQHPEHGPWLYSKLQKVGTWLRMIRAGIPFSIPLGV